MMLARTVEGAHGSEGAMACPRLHWAWPVSWAFLCGAMASGALTWPDRWRAHVFILWFLADPFTGALAQGVQALRWAGKSAWSSEPTRQSLEEARSPAKALSAFWRALALGWDGPGRALWWGAVASIAALILASRQGEETWRLFLFLAGSVLFAAAWERAASLPLSTGARASWAWFLGHWAFAPVSPLRIGVGILFGVGLAASLWGKGAKWLGRLAAWPLALGFLALRQPFLAAMAAGVALNGDMLAARDDHRPPYAMWRLAWLALMGMASIVLSMGVA